MNDETLELFDELIRDMQRRIDAYERRALYTQAEVVRVDKRLVELKRVTRVRQLQERAELEQGF
jgi:hypothetical protein